ncbi:MAG: phenylalanine--tRNA ligase subunit alpha [Bacteroidetes bacterium]|nr:phenylalanine--tRNA ligase subunit alpha [Bacteroidota bacterium]
MIEKINNLLKEIESFQASKLEEVEQFRIKMLAKKGLITELFQDFKSVEADKKREVGAKLNELKIKASDKLNELAEKLSNSVSSKEFDDFDPTKPVDFSVIGSRHPISIVRNRIIRIFDKIGFVVSEGPEIEDDWHNFSALNFPEDHPARDMQDTFFIEKTPDIALRTHTSSVQVRVMEKSKPPIRTISPGRVFRNEAISARAHCIFHQVEGLYIDKNVSFADMKQTLLYFAREMFGDKTQIRLRPSFFPFTEPSAEMDVSCNICGGSGCNICKYSGWIEIMGCGMVDPNVLKSCDIDPEIYSGYAFGMGIERMTMNLFQINDLRMFFENDTRFIKQFGSVI